MSRAGTATTSAAVNAGQKWSTEDDNALLEALLSNPDTSYDQLAERFQRTSGSVQNRALNLLLQKSSDEEPLEQLCQKYNVEWNLMQKYIEKREHRINVRREARQQARRTRNNGNGGNDNSALNTEALDLLKDLAVKIQAIHDKVVN